MAITKYYAKSGFIGDRVRRNANAPKVTFYNVKMKQLVNCTF